ncbi:hypothetical protein [Ancylobacter defluvii]|uniref:DUF4376 domain-containing protein n=1 Tax=Ancylobacter defluvii TaxID=1282440 RepID=A0A9W6NCH9_9HYPH|nr:hypothetical protein [Ancylobacter defluvii]MBS7586394.1 hypothetical protein [Ancylobacter defluvii]GLK85675.1 hypothetical protein GCM10017653_37450 [Ancylobacter defluvii]
MAKFLRVEDGVAVESIETEGDIAEMFSPSLLWVAAGAAEVGWSYADGAWTAPPPVVVDLVALRLTLKGSVDTAAERQRLKYITAGAGQAMTYQVKADEARRFALDTSPDPAAYPLLAAEVGITAEDLAGVAAVVTANYTNWLVIGSAIEMARLGAKRAIDEAATAEDARAAAEVSWPGTGS